jgi:hypothetical protein
MFSPRICRGRGESRELVFTENVGAGSNASDTFRRFPVRIMAETQTTLPEIFFMLFLIPSECWDSTASFQRSFMKNVYPLLCSWNE